MQNSSPMFVENIFFWFYRKVGDTRVPCFFLCLTDKNAITEGSQKDVRIEQLTGRFVKIFEECQFSRKSSSLGNEQILRDSFACKNI